MGLGSPLLKTWMDTVTAQPGRDPRNNQKYMQDDLQWDREVRGATAVLEDLLEKWKKEPPTQDHMLRLEFITDASYLIIIDFIIVIALVGHALRIALAVAYGIPKMLEHVQQQQTGI
ncbi:hypothetical protein EDB89DRAFT_1912660 [Lactarius sanguifluus]|nr:hypothetical protein EDB89DRAFT_1912660 [Lactarius sanguifluus]